MNTSEKELLEAARHGDRGAVDELLAAHEQQIYRFGLRMCGNEDAAREVLQETLIAAFRGLPSFRGEASLSTWLYQIARSFCIKERRHESPRLGLDSAQQLEQPGPGPEASALARQIGAALAASLQGLAQEHREAVLLRDVEGLSAEEAAQVIGIEVGALKSRLHRGRLQLRTDLAALLADGDDATPGGPCPELAHELSAYAALEVDQATCARIEEHLARCPRCRGACASLQRSVDLCRRLPGGDVPAPVKAAVRRALTCISSS